MFFSDIDSNLKRFIALYKELPDTTTRTFKGPVYVLQYEKLKSNMVTELIKLSQFLGTKQTNHDILCTVKEQEGSFHRNSTAQKRIQLLKFIYEKNQILKIKETAMYVEELLKRYYDIEFDLRGPESKLLNTTNKNG